MNFTCSVRVDVPRDFATDLFSQKVLQQHWQPDFRSVESVDGTPGQPGTKTVMKYESGKHRFDLIETVRVNELPARFMAEYETPGTCWNTMASTFTSLGESKTLWEAEIDYKFHGFMIRVMALLMPRLFRKETQKYLDNFKVFAEEQFSSQTE